MKTLFKTVVLSGCFVSMLGCADRAIEQGAQAFERAPENRAYVFEFERIDAETGEVVEEAEITFDDFDCASIGSVYNDRVIRPERKYVACEHELEGLPSPAKDGLVEGSQSMTIEINQATDQVDQVGVYFSRASDTILIMCEFMLELAPSSRETHELSTPDEEGWHTCEAHRLDATTGSIPDEPTDILRLREVK